MSITLNKKETLAYIKKGTNVSSKLVCDENDFKINVVGKKMVITENEPSLTDIMNELKSFEKTTNARFDSLKKEFKKDIKKIDTKLNNVIKLNNLKV